MSFESSFSEQSDFNFTHSLTGPLSPRESSECDNSLEFSHFNYLLPLNNPASDPTLREKNQVFFGYEEELIPMPLDEDMLDKSMSSVLKARLLQACTLEVLLDTDQRKNLIQTTHSGVYR